MKKLFGSTAFYNSFAIDESFIEQNNEQYKEIIKNICVENGIFKNKTYNYAIKDTTMLGYENFQTLFANKEESKAFFTNWITKFLNNHKDKKYAIKNIEIKNWDSPDELYDGLFPLGLIRSDAYKRVALREPNAKILKKYMTYGRKSFAIYFYEIEKNDRYEKEAKEIAKQLLRGE